MRRSMVERIVKKQINKVLLWVSAAFVLIILNLTVALVVSHNSEKKVYVNQNEEYRQQVLDQQRVIDSLEYEVQHVHEVYELNWQNVVYWLDYYEVKNKEVVLGQIYIETGNLTSNLCVNHNNLVGMYYPSVRPTVASGFVIADNGNRVSEYRYWWKSLEDYKLWQDYFGYEEMTFDGYAGVLDSHGYSITPGYWKTVMRVYEDYVKDLI